MTDSGQSSPDLPNNVFPGVICHSSILEKHLATSSGLWAEGVGPPLQAVPTPPPTLTSTVGSLTPAPHPPPPQAAAEDGAGVLLHGVPAGGCALLAVRPGGAS